MKKDKIIEKHGEMRFFKKDSMKYNKTKGRLMRAEYPEQPGIIDVTLSDGKKRCLYEGIVAHCAKDLSPNERKKIIVDCEKQIDSLKGGNCPTVFREMLNELKYGKFEEKETK